ncbi:hypothetical protein IV203_023866 [Nitzschia inconspicua]|uniref:Uncharacterized protein n=1 Tax=Nitzschia inconspicua TaxID=303405 RepID=A0A9K3KC90_9STRA|nr:hypothetical protein IV203_023866 [Nitzschia inconspicua]
MDEELILQRELMDSPPLPYQNLIRQEWGDFGGGSNGISTTPTAHIGKGDLVFQRPNSDDYLVVETKHLRTDSGSRARVSRTASRRKVVEQALRYGAIWRGSLGTDQGTVTMATYTNEFKDGSMDVGNDYFPSEDKFEPLSGNPSRQLHVLGQINYLAPQLWGKDRFNEILTQEDMAILEQEQFRQTFMVVRVQPYLLTSKNHFSGAPNWIPESLEGYLKRFANTDDPTLALDPQVAYLEELAESVLNQSGFYQPFSPHFIMAPNSKTMLLQKLQTVLRRLKR